MIFAFMPDFQGDERQALLLARSLRTFGGRAARAAILVPDPVQSPLSAPARVHLLFGAHSSIMTGRKCVN